MGLEVRRVPEDFDHPIGEIWPGFLIPSDLRSKPCDVCGGTGLNPATRRLDLDWYTLGWRHSLTHDEVQALADHGRLDCPGGRVPDAAKVNARSYQGMGHYGINRWICVEVRAKRLGIYGKCNHCKGGGETWKSKEQKRLHDAWEKTSPPEGEAYQIWETVTEGSPVSPPFLDPWDLARWMVENDKTITRGLSVDQWHTFITEVGYAISGVITSGTLISGVEAVVEQRKERRQ
jgi:hypothetical protein